MVSSETPTGVWGVSQVRLSLVGGSQVGFSLGGGRGSVKWGPVQWGEQGLVHWGAPYNDPPQKKNLPSPLLFELK